MHIWGWQRRSLFLAEAFWVLSGTKYKRLGHRIARKKKGAVAILFSVFILAVIVTHQMKRDLLQAQIGPKRPGRKSQRCGSPTRLPKMLSLPMFASAGASPRAPFFILISTIPCCFAVLLFLSGTMLQMMGKWRVSAPKLVGLHRQVVVMLDQGVSAPYFSYFGSGPTCTWCVHTWKSQSVAWLFARTFNYVDIRVATAPENCAI